jgi:hypothetical protein
MQVGKKNKINLKKKNKGNLTAEEIMKLVLVGGAIIILLILFFKLVFPFDKEKETAKGYFDEFKKSVMSADKGETGEFVIWDDKKMFLVYFGDKILHAYKEENRPGIENQHVFLVGLHDPNYICMCYDVESEYETYQNEQWRKTTCKFCESMDKPVLLKGFTTKNEAGPWAIKKDDKIKITKEKDNYVFTKA